MRCLHIGFHWTCGFIGGCLNAEEAEPFSETERTAVPVILGAPLGLLWSLSPSWWVDEIPIRQMDGLPIRLLFGHLDVLLPPGSFFSLRTVMILAMVVAAPIHSFNNFHYSGQLSSGSWPFLSELCVFLFRDLWIVICRSMFLCGCSSSWSSFTYIVCLLN